MCLFLKLYFVHNRMINSISTYTVKSGIWKTFIRFCTRVVSYVKYISVIPYKIYHHCESSLYPYNFVYVSYIVICYASVKQKHITHSVSVKRKQISCTCTQEITLLIGNPSRLYMVLDANNSQSMRVIAMPPCLES